MKKNLFFYFGLLLFCFLSAKAWGQGVVLDWGHQTPGQMKYVFQENDEGIPPVSDANGKQWYEVDYDDSAWGTLIGSISRGDRWGVGEGNYYNWENEYGCFYLRRTFNVNLSEVNTENIWLKSFNDDHADYYVNGLLVQSTDEFDWKVQLPSDALVDGVNTIAVYVNDCGGGDAYLDFTIADPAGNLSFYSPYQDDQGVQYEYNETNEEWEVFGQNWWTNDFVLPATIMEKPVTVIRDNVFSGGVCNSISLPEGLRHIGWFAFESGTLTSISIPASVTEIDGGILAGCNSLTSITVAEGNTVYDSRENCNAIIQTDENKVVATCPATVLPASVTCIGHRAYQNSSITEFIIPEAVTSIENEAFEGCTNLYKVTVLSATPFDLSEYAFPDRGQQILYVPVGSKEAYQNAPYWQDFGNIFELGEEEVFDPMGYAYLSDEGATLKFVYDDQYFVRKKGGVVLFTLDEPEGEPRWYASGANGSISHVKFDPSFADARPTSTHSWIREMPLESLEGLEYLNTSEVTTMNAMFYYTSSITSLDLSTFDTSKVTEMCEMFHGCSGLTSLDLSGFDTSNVSQFGNMFNECSSLTSLDLSMFDTSQVENTDGMFAYSGLSEVTLSISMSNLFDNAFEGVGAEETPCCLNVPDGFDFGDVDTSSGVFVWKGGWFETNAIPAPRFSPSDGETLFDGETVTVTFNDSKYVLRYTTDGSDPKEEGAVVSTSSESPTSITVNYQENESTFVVKAFLEDATSGNQGTTITYTVQKPYDRPYAFYSEGTLTFYYDDQYSIREGDMFYLYEGDNDPDWWGGGGGVCQSVTHVVFDPSFASARPTSTRCWLRDMPQLESIEGLEYLNTSEVTTMHAMFCGTSMITSLDLSTFDTSNVTDMSYMFHWCGGLTSLDLSTFDMSNVANTEYMLSYTGLRELTLSASMSNLCDYALENVGRDNDPCHLTVADGFDFGDTDTTADVFGWKGGWFHMGEPFAYDGSYAVLVGSTLTFYSDDQRANRGYYYRLGEFYFNHSAVKRVVFDEGFAREQPSSTREWFSGMTNLVEIEGLDLLNTSQVNDMAYMFNECSSLTSLDLSTFKASNVWDFSGMLSGCSGLTSLTLSASMDQLWDGACEGIGTEENPCQLIVAEGFDIGDEADTSADSFNWKGGWFHTETNINYIGSYVVFNDGTLTFYHDGQRSSHEGDKFKLKEGDNDPDWWNWGDGVCKSVTHVVFDPSFVDARPTSTREWLRDMPQLESIEGLEYLNTSEVTTMYAMFCGSTITSLDLSTFDTSNVADMSYMFNSCSSLTSIDLSTFDISSVENTEHMLSYTGLQEVALSLSMSNLWDSAFEGVGSEEDPVQIATPAGFDFGGADPFADHFFWKGGWFVYNGIPSPIIQPANTETLHIGDMLTITFDADKYILYYTTDGSDPKEEGGAVTTCTVSPVNIKVMYRENENTLVVKTFLKKVDTGEQGDVVTMTYAVADPYVGPYAMTNSVSTLIEWGRHTPCQMKYVFQQENDGSAPAPDGNGKQWYEVGYDDSSWGVLNGPIAREDYWGMGEGRYHNWPGDAGCFYLRRTFDVNLSEVDVNNIYLRYEIDDDADFYLNGVNIHHYTYGGTAESLLLPADALVDGVNTLAIYVIDYGGGAYIDFTINTNSTLTFYCDDQRDFREGVKYGFNEGNNEPEWFNDGMHRFISHIVFDPSFADARPTSTHSWIREMPLESIEGLENLNTSEVTTMNAMFCGTSSITSLDLSTFDISCVTDMGNMFSGCGITSLDLSTFDIGSVESTEAMFAYSGLKEVTLSASMSKLSDNAFEGVGSEENPCHLNVPKGFDFGDVDTSFGTFGWKSGYFCFPQKPYVVLASDGTLVFRYDNKKDVCTDATYDINGGYDHKAITAVVIDKSFADYRPTSAAGWFQGMSQVTSFVGLENIYADQLMDVSNMFNGCSSVCELNLSNFNLSTDSDESQVQTTGMLSGCTDLKELTLHPSMYIFGEEECSGIGTQEEPCELHFLSPKFDFGSGINYEDSSFEWKSGWFHLSGFPYSVITSNGQTVTFYCDFNLKDHESRKEEIHEVNYRYTHRNITKAVFDSSFANARPTSTRWWFAEMDQLINIEGLNNLNTSKVTDMSEMFRACGVSGLDLTSFDTRRVATMKQMFADCGNLSYVNLGNLVVSQVTDISEMFRNCAALRSINVSQFNTSGVTDMHELFSGCQALSTINLSNFDTGNVTDLHGMFTGCGILATIDVSNFNTGKVTNMRDMFNGCGSLATLDLSNFDTSSLLYMDGMFSNSGISSINLDGFNTGSVESMANLFDGCANLTELNLSDFDTSNVKEVDWDWHLGYNAILRNCSSLQSLALPVSMENIMAYVWESPFENVGNEWNPCALMVPENFKFDDSIDTSAEQFEWGGGWFYLASTDDDSNMYVVVSDEGKTLTFYCDEERNTHQNTYKVNHGYDHDPVTRVTFHSSFADARPTSCRQWFAGMEQLVTITSINNLNTESVTDMSNMFKNCKSLRSINVSKFNTGNVQDMHGMFVGCENLRTITLGATFNTGNVTDMHEMFACCSSLTSIDLSKFDTGNVTDMHDMFSSCWSLSSINLSNFDTGNVTDMHGLFFNCGSLASINLSNFDTGNVTNMRDMFNGCGSLSTLDLSNFDTSSLIYMDGMFCNSGIASINFDGFETETVESMANLFDGCGNLTELNLSGFDTSNVREVDWGWHLGYNAMLRNCTKLGSLSLPASMENIMERVWESPFENVGKEWNPCALMVPEGFKFDDSIDASKEQFEWGGGWFYLASTEDDSNMYVVASADGKTLTFYCDEERDSHQNTYRVNKGYDHWPVTHVVFDESFGNAQPTSVSQWFAEMPELYVITGLEYLNTSSVTDMSEMFKGCGSLADIDLSNFDTSHVTDMHGMFRGCSGLASIDLSTFDTSNVTDMSDMFNMEWDGPVYIGLDGLFTSCNVTDMHDMFRGCNNLQTLDLSNFETGKVTDMHGMFANCSNLVAINMNERVFDTGNVTDMRDMFNGCSNLPTFDLSNFDESSLLYIDGMFANSGITTIKFGNFKAANVESMGYLFDGCDKLTNINLSGFDTSNVKWIDWDWHKGYSAMLRNCINLDSLTLPESMSNILDIVYEAPFEGVGKTWDPCQIFVRTGIFEFCIEDPYKKKYFEWGGGNFLYLLGDVNGDGSRNITDVASSIGYTMGESVPSFHPYASDTNGDGTTSITDISIIIDLILNDVSYDIPANARRTTNSKLQVRESAGDLAILLDSNEPFTACEMIVTLPEGARLMGVEVDAGRSYDHQAALGDLGDGRYRIVLYSASNAELTENRAPLLHLYVDGDKGGTVKLSDVLFTNKKYENVLLPEVCGTTTGIGYVNAEDKEGPAYSIQGIKTTTPKRGVYIQNGQKVVVK